VCGTTATRSQEVSAPGRGGPTILRPYGSRALGYIKSARFRRPTQQRLPFRFASALPFCRRSAAQFDRSSPHPATGWRTELHLQTGGCRSATAAAVPPAREERRPATKRAAAAAVSGMVLVCVAVRLWDELCDKEGIQRRSIAKRRDPRPHRARHFTLGFWPRRAWNLLSLFLPVYKRLPVIAAPSAGSCAHRLFDELPAWRWGFLVLVSSSLGSLCPRSGWPIRQQVIVCLVGPSANPNLLSLCVG
jgi:hypothetical protein